MAERKKSPIEKDLGQKKNPCKNEDEVKNRATEAKKKDPQILKWMIGWTKKKKKVQYRKDEVKNRADGQKTKKDKKGQKKKKTKK